MNMVADAVFMEKTSVVNSDLQVVLKQIRNEAKGINSYEFVNADGGNLPPFTAGAHIDVHIGPGVVRQYSISNNPSEQHRYVIGVLNDPNGRGGSKRLHETFKVQDVIKISAPRNNFELDISAKHVILIAGGIGITPLMSMAHELRNKGKSFELHYCSREMQTIAFVEVIKDWQNQGMVKVHLDQGDPKNGLSLPALLSEVRDDTHIYYCGPQGFMQACEQAASHWPKGTVKCEHFKAPELSEADAAKKLEPGAFIAKIASTGQEIEVKANQTLSDALGEAGVNIPTSCVSGLCGTCRIGFLSGEVDHQDYILSSDEQTKFLTACVSRAKSGVLVLDL